MVVRYLEWLLVVWPTYLLLFGDPNPWLMVPNFLGFLCVKGARYAQRGRPVISESAFFAIFVLLILNFFGDSVFELYYTVLHYDKVLHFLAGVVLTWVFYLVFKVRSSWWPVAAGLSSMGIGAIWEMIEFVIDGLSGQTIMQGVVINLKVLSGSFEDTVIDLFWSLIGVLLCVSAIALYRIAKRKRTWEDLNPRPTA